MRPASQNLKRSEVAVFAFERHETLAKDVEELSSYLRALTLRAMMIAPCLDPPLEVVMTKPVPPVSLLVKSHLNAGGLVKTLAFNLRRVVRLGVPLLALACSDGQITSPETESVYGSALSLSSDDSQLYGTNGGLGRPSTLYAIDATTGAATAIGPTGFTAVGGLAFDDDGTLYGVSIQRPGFGPPGPPPILITIDLTTGAGTAVGTIGGAFDARFDLSFNDDDVLFATGFVGAFAPSRNMGSASSYLPFISAMNATLPITPIVSTCSSPNRFRIRPKHSRSSVSAVT